MERYTGASSKNKVIAIVANEETGRVEQVELTFVQTSPKKEVRGRVLGFQTSSGRSWIPRASASLSASSYAPKRMTDRARGSRIPQRIQRIVDSAVHDIAEKIASEMSNNNSGHNTGNLLGFDPKSEQRDESSRHAANYYMKFKEHDRPVLLPTRSPRFYMPWNVPPPIMDPTKAR